VQASGRRAKFLYTVPNFHNPAGVSMVESRRDEVLEICSAAGLLVLEDNPYGLLGFDGPPTRAIRARSSGPGQQNDDVLYLGSFSKTFAPGLRVGWVLAPHAVREKLVLAAEAAVLCPPQLNQMVVAEYLATQDWQGQVSAFRGMYRERRDAMLDALRQQMPTGTTWTHPTGGFYVWVTLPGDLDSKVLLPRAVTARVAFVPGTAFFADGSGRSHLRCRTATRRRSGSARGVRRLAMVLEEEVELRETFGSTGISKPSRPQSESPSPDMA
jgi:DNA-binding transcriptional MocR family regulator